MRIFHRGWTHLLVLLLATLPFMAAAGANDPAPSARNPGATKMERPRIALVLSGGGAKGSAHIGVLKVLEAKHIPVDIIVGTSMGSYVAGMYAMGLSAEEVERTTLAIDWNKGYQDKVGRDELSLRKKQQTEKYQLRTDIGVNGDQTQLPHGFFQGQSMASLLRHATSNLPAQKSFDNLPIPYRAVATDMETVTPFVLDHGSLAKAMQASMSIPGALKPVDWDGRILADGGTVNNMPVDVAKAMGADVVIAVDISAKLRTRESLKSGLAMIDQLTTYMTQVGTEKQKALLGPRDILLTPEFGNMGIADFALMPEGIKIGEAVANSAAARLDALSLSPAAYADYRNGKLSRRAERSGQPAYYIDKVEIINKSRLSDDTVRAMLNVRPDKVQTYESLEAGIRRLYALESFDRITYEVEERDGENVLVVDASEKNWGPGYLNFQLGFSDDFESSSNYNVGMSYTLTNVNDWGGEWLTEASLGTAKHLKTDFYTPLEPSQTYFGETSLAYDKTQRRVFFPEESRSSSGVSYLDSEYSFTSVDLAVGWNRQPWSRFSLGLEGKIGSVEIQNLTNADADASAWGPYIRFEHDTLDSRYFPYQGVYWDIKGGLLLRRSRPRGRALRAGRGGELPAGDDQALVLGQAQPQPDAGRGRLKLPGDGTAVRAGSGRAVPHVRLPALPVERSLQPVRRAALHLPGGGQRLRRLQGAPVPRGLPRARGGLGQGRGHQYRILLYLGFPLYGGGEFPRSHLPRLWRGGGGTRHVLSAIGHYVPIRAKCCLFVNSPWVGGLSL